MQVRSALRNPGSSRKPMADSRKPLSVLPQHPNHSSLNLHGICCDHDRRHRCIRRLQTNLWTFAIEALQRRLTAIDESDDDLTVARILRLLDHHVVAVNDVLVLHRVAANFEYEDFFRARDVFERNRLRILVGLYRTTRSDAS